MADLDLCFTPATELAQRIRRGDLSPITVVENCLARIDEINPTLNCFCFVYHDEALEKARDAERAAAAGEPLGPLHGVPVAIKDLTPTKGKRTTMGSHLREHWVPERDAIVVERLLAAGAILVGKTTTPEFAHTYLTESPLWGVTRNPWNRDHTPGGSSGGAAAAVATGCVPLAEGSDMGGSIRTPAAFCGLVGLKPSFGRIPFEFFPSVFDQTCHIGPLARTVDDAALFLAVTQGPDERDPQSFAGPLALDVPVPGNVTGLKLAFSPDLGYCAIDPEVEANARRAVETLRKAGAEVVEIDAGFTPEFEQAGWAHWNVYYAAMLGDDLPKWRERMDPRLVGMVEAGLAMSAVDHKKLEFAQTRLWQTLQPIFAKYDALLCPTTARPAPHLDEPDTDVGRIDDAGRYHGLELTFPFNLASRCPALSVPTGFTTTGLPTALQIVGRRHDDAGVLRIGATLESTLAWPTGRPPI